MRMIESKEGKHNKQTLQHQHKISDMHDTMDRLNRYLFPLIISPVSPILTYDSTKAQTFPPPLPLQGVEAGTGAAFQTEFSDVTPAT
jgi:hypothetical protein